MKKFLKLGLALGLVLGLLVLGYYAYLRWLFEWRDPLLQAPAGTAFRKVGEDTLAYRGLDRGAKTTVVFVGGLAAWHGSWWRTVEALAAHEKHLNFVALDLPPFGFSLISPRAGYSRAEQAARIGGFLRQMHGQKIILVAHSYGAGPAAEAVLADKHQQVKRFIIIDGVLNVDEARPESRSLMDIGWLRDLGVGLTVHNNWFVTRQIKGFVYITKHVNAPLVAVYTQAFDCRNTTAKLSRWVYDYGHDRLLGPSAKGQNYRHLKIPVRILWGDHDSLTPLALTKVLLANLAHAKLDVLKDVGHIPMIENIPLFDAALRRAIRN